MFRFITFTVSLAVNATFSALDGNRREEILVALCCFGQMASMHGLKWLHVMSWVNVLTVKGKNRPWTRTTVMLRIFINFLIRLIFAFDYRSPIFYVICFYFLEVIWRIKAGVFNWYLLSLVFWSVQFFYLLNFTFAAAMASWTLRLVLWNCLQKHRWHIKT